MTSRDDMTTKPSQPTTECSHDPPKWKSARDLVIELRFEIDRFGQQVRALEADRAAIVELLLATGVEPASGDPVQLAAQVAEWVRHACAALVEIRDETADTELSTVWTAANGALKGINDE